MINRGSGGTIVNISSGSGLVGLPVRTMYSSSKFGLAGFGEALRPEVAGHNIQVVNAYPGYVKTNISKNAMTSDGTKFGKTDSNIAKGMTAEKCVDWILRGVCLGRTEIIVGKLLEQSLPFLKLNSWLVNKILLNKYKSQIKVAAKAK